MTPDEFTVALLTLGWSQLHLSQRLDCSEKLCRRWAAGEAVVPPSIAAWLSKLVAAHARLPAPVDWRVRQLPSPL